MFHDQVGYWLWAPDDDRVVQTLTIPRGVALVAEGRAEVAADAVRLAVAADADRGIAQSAFMFGGARTVGFSHEIELVGDELRYRETTRIDIYGERGFEHTDSNRLRRQRHA